MKIPLASTSLRTNDIEAAKLVLDSSNYTMGKKVKEFENLMASYLGVEHFIMVNSGSSANLLIFEALLRPSIGNSLLEIGDKILVPAVAWPTTIWPIIQLGLKPIFVDVNLDSLAIDLDLAQESINQTVGIKAIFPIHPLGFAINHNDLNDFCIKNNIIQINDVCESLGSWRDNVHAGTFGLASSFSFYFSHHITTMEGGGIATNSSKFADDIRAMRSHGWSRDRTDAISWKNKFQSELSTSFISQNQLKFQFITTGYNFRPLEIGAAIGIEQLKDLDSFVTRRRHVAKYIKNELKETIFEVVDGGSLNHRSMEESHSWMFICLRINKEMSKDIRIKLDKLLEKYEIESRPVLTGNFLSQPVMRLFSDMPEPSDYPSAQFISTNYFMVSAHHDLTDLQIEYLATSLKRISVDIN
jgi:CDP-6-deoxy-D-xylo-4-hexulose-3-dehydrase